MARNLHKYNVREEVTSLAKVLFNHSIKGSIMRIINTSLLSAATKAQLRQLKLLIAVSSDVDVVTTYSHGTVLLNVSGTVYELNKAELKFMGAFVSMKKKDSDLSAMMFGSRTHSYLHICGERIKIRDGGAFYVAFNR